MYESMRFVEEEMHDRGVRCVFVKTGIDTAAEAAQALRPLAGEAATVLLALGLVGTGLLAVPVLTASSAYAVAETFGFRGSLALPAGRALGFYGIVAAATLGGAALAATNGSTRRTTRTLRTPMPSAVRRGLSIRTGPHFLSRQANPDHSSCCFPASRRVPRGSIRRRR